MLIAALLIMSSTGTNVNARLEVSTLWDIHYMHDYMAAEMIMTKFVNT